MNFFFYLEKIWKNLHHCKVIYTKLIFYTHTKYILTKKKSSRNNMKVSIEGKKCNFFLEGTKKTQHVFFLPLIPGGVINPT